MGRAEDLDAFRSALERLRVPLLYVVYADAEANLLYLFNVLVPQRASGDWYVWARTVPGARSETLWHDYLDFAELPLLVNPASGYVMNANDPPWTATRTPPSPSTR